MTPSIQSMNKISHDVIGAAIEVHRQLGPGLLESAYRECLAREFTLRGIPFEREKPIRLEYKGIVLEAGYRLDFLVAQCVVVELKAIEALAPVHDAQLISPTRWMAPGLAHRFQCFRFEEWHSSQDSRLRSRTASNS